MADFEKHLAGVDARLKVEPYNTFTTGTDKVGSPMMVLSDMDEYGDTVTSAIGIVPDQKMAVRAAAMIDRHCGEPE